MPEWGSGAGGAGWQFRDANDSVIDPMVLEAYGRRMSFAKLVAPKAVADPAGISGIMALAQSAQSDADFEKAITETGGFVDAGQWAAELATMPDDRAYITFHHMPAKVQRAITRQGYTPKGYGEVKADGDGKASGIGRAIPIVGGAFGAVTGFLGEEVLHPVGEGMAAAGRASTQAWRTVERMAELSKQDDDGLGNVAPGRWQNAWTEVGNGDTFVLQKDRQTLREEYELTNEELDTYLALSQGELPGEIAIDEGFTMNTPEHEQRVIELYEMSQSPTGQELTGNLLQGDDGMLNNYRVSFGRNFARSVGFEADELDNGWGKAVSGSGDMAYAIFADPTLVLGKINKGTRMARWVMTGIDDIDMAVDAAYVARGVDDAGWAVERSLGVPGLRNVTIKTPEGIAEMSASRLAYGRRVNRAVDMMNRAMTPGTENAAEVQDLFRALPDFVDSFDSLQRISRSMIDDGIEGGLSTPGGVYEFLKSTEGQRMLVGTRFGGRNTAEALKLPTIGKAGYARIQAKGLGTKLIDWSQRTDARLMEEIGTSSGRFGQTIRPLAHPIKQAKRAAISPLQFANLFTTHVPHRGYLGLYAEDAVGEFDRFLQMGRRVGMTSDETAGYMRSFLGKFEVDQWGDEIPGKVGDNAAMRASVVRNYTADLLSRFDIGEGSDIYERFVSKIDEAYGLDRLGAVKPGRAIMPAQLSEGIAIPSMRDLIMQTNRFSVTRSMFGRGGYLNPGIIDAGLTRVWKPAVLMRLGFIGRAGGEELLSYLARFGIREYVGITMATHVAKRQIYDDIMKEVGHVPTREQIIDFLDRTPDRWDEMVAFAGRNVQPGDGSIPSPYEVLTWGQAQSLTPFTGAIHAFDTVWRKVMLAPWEGQMDNAPVWRQRVANGLRHADITAMRTSMRVSRGTRVSALRFDRAPGIRQGAAMLDTVLNPWLTKAGLEADPFMSAAARGIPDKAATAKYIGRLTDKDMDRLKNLATDPFIRRAMLEEVTGGATMNVAQSQAAENGPVQFLPEYNPKTGQVVEMPMKPQGNKTTMVERPDGTYDMQRTVDYYGRYIQSLRQVWDPKVGLPDAILRSMSGHLSPGAAKRVARLAGGEGDELVRVQAFAKAVQALDEDTILILRDAIEDGAFTRIAGEMAQASSDPTTSSTLIALSDLEDEVTQSMLLNPALDPGSIHTDFNKMMEDLRLEVAKRMHTPGNARVLESMETRSDEMIKPPVDGYIPAYGIAGNQRDAVWAVEHLIRENDEALYGQFIAALAPRLEKLRMDPGLADAIADDIFSSETPMSMVQGVWRDANKTSTPVALTVSSDPRLMDEVTNVLSGITGRNFHMQRLDVGEDQLAARAGTGGVHILDGAHDWQESILWRSQMEDFSSATPLPPEARATLIEVPNPDINVYDSPIGPPEPEVISGVVPTTQTWDWPTDVGEPISILDVIGELPPSEAGMVRVWGIRYFDADETYWYKQSPFEIEDIDDPADWLFADIPEGDWARMTDPPLEDEIERIADPHHFATETEQLHSVGEDGSIMSGWQAEPVPFEYTNLDPQTWTRAGFSPTHYVAEHEDTLRRLSTVDARRLDPSEIDDEIREVAERVARINADDLTIEGPLGAAARRILARKSDEMLIEGRKANLIHKRQWADEDDVANIARGLGGEMDRAGVDELLDSAIAQLENLTGQGTLSVEDAAPMLERLEAAKATNVSTLAGTEEAVAVRNAAVQDLDALMPGWKGSEGWARPGTNTWFGTEYAEPVRTTPTQIHYTAGVTPGYKDTKLVDDQVDQIVRYLTNAQAGGQTEQRVLHEILNPLATGGRNRIDMELAGRPPLKEMPLESTGQLYVNSRVFAWDRLTNAFFDDVASKAIASMVRNQLFARNYLKAADLAEPLVARLTNPKLRAAMEPIMAKFGLTTDDLDELIELERNGLLAVPAPDMPRWSEILDEADAELYGLPAESRLDHENVVDSWGSSVIRPPNPRLPIDEANRVLRTQLGLKDTPLGLATRREMKAVRAKIDEEAGEIWQARMREFNDPESADLAVKNWRRENKEAHEELFEEGRQRAQRELEAERASGGMAMTNRPELAQAQAPKPMYEGGQQVGEYPGTMLDYEIVDDLSGTELATLRRYMNQRINALDTARDATVGRAFQGTIPFIDDHRIRSQFQEYVGNLVPFWFAEEQFLKRWTRILTESPEAIRKGQLVMHGLRTVGFIKHDESTDSDYFVYPGSAAATSFLSETPVAKLIFGNEASLPVGMALTGDVQHTLPGFGDQMGVPSAGPFVGLTLEMLASRSPEWAQAQEEIMGERGTNKAISSYLVPTSISRFYTSLTHDMEDRDIAQAMVQAAQLMQASGHGLKEDASPKEQQEYLDLLEANARTVSLVRAIYGFAAPASPQLSVELPLADEFQAITESGLQYSEALMLFAEHHEGDISPYTVFKSEVPSNAPLAATSEALFAMEEYDEQLAQFPMAAPWLLMPFRAEAGEEEDEFSNRAYRHQIRYGLRELRSPEEYIDALAWADASPEYFDTIEKFDMQSDAYRAAGETEIAQDIDKQRTAWAEQFRNTHPTFNDKLMSSESRVQRQQILREAIELVDYPGIEDKPNIAQMKEMLGRFTYYKDQLEGLNESRSRAAVALKEEITNEFEGWMGIHLMNYPQLRYFYDRVLRPELRWNRSEEGGI